MPLQQFRQACRSLARVPGLTTVSILTVALGVGAGTSLFSIVKAVLLNPLPYPHAERLVWLSEVNDHGRPMSVSMQNFLDWQGQNHSFASLAAFAYDDVNAGSDVPERSQGAAITPGFFETLGVQPAMGRGFLPADHRRGAPLAVVISNGFWQRLYGGNPGVLGRTIRLNGEAGSIVGIMPPGFSYPEKTELWVSAIQMGDWGTRTAHNFRVIGRLKPGITLEQAQTDLSEIAQRLKREFPGPFMGRDALLTPLNIHVAGKVRPALLILFAAVGLLILIVCVNVANLLLVRVTARSRELAVRIALGAGRGRLIRQLLLESLILALSGGTLGFLIAFWSNDLLKILLPADVPRASEIGMDWGVLGFALAVSAAAGLLFGVLPAWRATRMNVHDAVKAGSRSVTAGRGSRMAQSALVVSEVCLSLALLAGAGLLANSFVRLRSVEPGFRGDGVLVSQIYFSFPRNESDRQQLRARYTDLLTRVRALPGVESAGTASSVPLQGAPDGMFQMAGGAAVHETLDADYVVISPGYLQALRIPLLSGRDFSESDVTSGPGVAIVSSEMARRFWPGRSPLGERIWFNSFEQNEHWLTIVGVAADTREEGLTQRLMPVAYVCYKQASRLAVGNLLVRARVDPTSLSGPVRAALRAADPQATVVFTTMDGILAQSVSQQRFQMQVLGAFAALALLLAAVGLYGVLSYMVSASRAEIGIRMALGAPPISVFRMVALRAMTLACTGVAIGLAVFLGLRQALATLLFGVGPGDPTTLASATAVLLAVALAAAWLPARRAMKVEPVEALREE